MTADCIICQTPTHHPAAYACRRCKRIIERLDTRRTASGERRRFDRQARIDALRRAWDPTARAFRCHYTGVELLTDNQHSNLYLSLEHQTPGDEGNVVIVSSLINRMKTDLSDRQFRQMVQALAASFDGQGFDASAFPETRPRDG
jgi:hypothetical protein